MLAFILVVAALQRQPSQQPQQPMRPPSSGQQQQSTAPQLPQLPPQVLDTSPFRRLSLPTPTPMRTGSGAPGAGYWQQRADYTIQATLDTATHSLSGRETIRYTNHSPDTLRYVWLQLDQNIYRDDSRGTALNAPNERFAGAGFSGGYTIQKVEAVRRPAGKPAAGTTARAPLTLTANGTVGRVDLDRPLAPGGSVEIELAYSFQIPEHGSDRMGREQYGTAWVYEMAQWYPRMAVYDDVRGWNTEQYLGQGEFYLEYGDFDVQITVPRSFIVVATGTLANPMEVLTAAQRARLAQAAKSDTTVAIVARAEVGQASTRPAGTGPTLTWHFTAKNVRDVAWGASSNFIWDASGWSGVLIQSAYPREADADWQNSTAYSRHTIQHYSEKWFRYPYPVATNVAGPVNGMEYPMIVFCSARFSGFNLYSVTTHELGHQWFPMVVGSNERLYAWMDEGFNTFINIYSIRSFYPDSQWERRRGDPQAWAKFAATGHDEPPMLSADRIDERALGQVAYTKPAVGLYLLRQYIVGDTARFDTAFREYVRRWAFKHPTPADFFRSMEDGLGEDLSWFWRGWFYSTDVVDIAVDSVKTGQNREGTPLAGVFLSSPGRLPMPVDLKITFANGSTDRVRLPVEVWYQGDEYLYVRKIASDVSKVEVDPDSVLPDVRRANNVWVKR
ncbi:MAG TPA: M1 family metallopeptidase [Gemmatimonadales bacterium]|nr:M1 family metallopeptidase [Gemmatimonadales bacterium]